MEKIASQPLTDARAYSGYRVRQKPEDDGFLTSVGPGTPGGEYLRRYWHPFLLASELEDLPVPVRLLAEDLVVFRDKSGRLGLLHRNCAHRGASLEFGIIAERGIRCCYHGWHFDVDGTILDTPAEPASSKIKENFCQGAYPVVEWKGLLFTYMGPAEERPVFPTYDTVDFPLDNQVAPFRMNLPCNWVQIVENGADPIHNAYLHAIVAGQQFSPAFNVLPQLDFPLNPMGFLSMATRKVGDFLFVRASDIMLPNFGQFPSGNNEAKEEGLGVRPFLTRWAVAVDDNHSFYIGLAHLNSYTNPENGMKPSQFGVDKIPFIGQTGDRPYPERQKEPGDYDAVVSQGLIANRKAEHLGTADRGVVLFRRLLGNAIKETMTGKIPVIPRRTEDGRTRTYAHEVVVRLPSNANLDRPAAVAELGKDVARAFLQTDHMVPAEREAEVMRRIRVQIDALNPLTTV